MNEHLDILNEILGLISKGFNFKDERLGLWQLTGISVGKCHTDPIRRKIIVLLEFSGKTGQNKGWVNLPILPKNSYTRKFIMEEIRRQSNLTTLDYVQEIPENLLSETQQWYNQKLTDL